MQIENLLFDIAEALRYPVMILILLALVAALVEAGALMAELYKRRGRGIERLDFAMAHIRSYLAVGDNQSALNVVHELGYNDRMSDAYDALILQRGLPDSEDKIAKRLAEYDYSSLKKLERSRILVRMGPALGLMGTLIPLSPALAALADGNVERLTTDLRVAFSVTVTGLLIGMIAFGVSLVRDRLYAQDFSDVEYVAAALDDIPSAPLTHAQQSVGHAAAGA
ncbi:MAG: MotA/TolQ/ExbB proton channel family protein [Solirubrobacterales bacterium]|nr:MotA/TolQ/ExbB proton channel family protein [Solirubrobacterales bacterium]